mgnify:CR=1 FL=1|jgi:plasmid maintenance system killer protein
MEISFEDEDLEELIFTGKNHKYKKLSKDKAFMRALIDVYNYMDAASCANDLKSYSFLHYEALKHIGLSSVRIMNGRVERLLFAEYENGIRITIIELNETHYGKKK